MKAASSPATEPNFYSMEPCTESTSVPANIEDDSSDGEIIPFLALPDPLPDLIPSSLKKNTSWDSMEAPPAVVSLPSTPEQVCKTVPTVAASDIPFEVMMPTDEHGMVPQAGDEVFFEGKRFRYLDHFDMSEFEEDEDESSDSEAQVSAFASV